MIDRDHLNQVAFDLASLERVYADIAIQHSGTLAKPGARYAGQACGFGVEKVGQCCKRDPQYVTTRRHGLGLAARGEVRVSARENGAVSAAK